MGFGEFTMSVCFTCDLLNARDIACNIVYLLIGKNVHVNSVRVFFEFNYVIYCVKILILFIVNGYMRG